MKIKTYMSLAIIMALTASLSGCIGLIPDEVRGEMGGRRAKPAADPFADYPELRAYRIDDHRSITIQGRPSDCQGMIYYTDTRLGIHTAVGETGFSTASSGPYAGYYAIDSDFIVIPAMEFSQIFGIYVDMYYSTDQGRTFRYFTSKAQGIASEFLIVKDNYLYFGERARRENGNFVWASRYDLSGGVAVGYHHEPKSGERWVDPKRVPVSTTSPSGEISWNCGYISRKKIEPLTSDD